MSTTNSKSFLEQAQIFTDYIQTERLKRSTSEDLAKVNARMDKARKEILSKISSPVTPYNLAKQMAVSFYSQDKLGLISKAEEFLRLPFEEQTKDFFYSTAIGIWLAWTDGELDNDFAPIVRWVNFLVINTGKSPRAFSDEHYGSKGAPSTAKVIEFVLAFAFYEFNLKKTGKETFKDPSTLREHFKKYFGSNYKNELKDIFTKSSNRLNSVAIESLEYWKENNKKGDI